MGLTVYPSRVYNLGNPLAWRGYLGPLFTSLEDLTDKTPLVLGSSPGELL
jgi:hypothetical protein